MVILLCISVLGYLLTLEIYLSILKVENPIILYVCGQALNILLTFLAAYLMFNVVFTNITEKLLK